MWKEILKQTWGTQKGYAFIAYGGSGHPWGQNAYRYPEELDMLVAKATEVETFTNVYFCPHLFLTPMNKKKENSAKVGAIWLDKDSGTLKDIKPKPTICWTTSEGRHQALWVLKRVVEPERAEKVAMYLAYAIHGSDRGCWNLGRVIRFPGSRNYKYSPPEHGDLLWKDGPVYDISDLEPKEKTELESLFDRAKELKPPNMPKDIPKFTDALVAYGRRIPAKVWELLGTAPDPGQDWSVNLWKMERLLIEAGVPLEYTFAIVRDSPWNKYKRDNRPERDLWAEIHKATLEKGPLREDPHELPWVTMDELMLYSERPEWLVDGIWMQKNVGWIAGVGKSYKSILSVDLALSVASGAPFLGKYKVRDPGCVLMVQEEDPVWRVAQRVQVMSEYKGISNLQLSHDSRSLVLEVKENRVPLYVSIGGGVLFKDKTRTDVLEEAIERHKPKLLVLDPMFMIAAGLDEFKSGEMAHALNIMKHWRNRYNCAIAVVHHYRKSTGSSVERLYGSQALYAWSENNMFVSRTNRESQIVIDLDIKDAKRDDSRIFVDFDDIDETYMYTVNEQKAAAETNGKFRVGPAGFKVVNFLKSVKEGDTTTKQAILKETGVNEKTITAKLKELEKKKAVILTKSGVGNEVHIEITAAFHDIEVDDGSYGGVMM